MRRREWVWIAAAAGLAYVFARQQAAAAPAPAPAVTPVDQTGTAADVMKTLYGGDFSI